mmetsp:Transcript_47473/g.146207  ORF Transcript_47473/g.146207 Transcript_47473/m.146207 type:complete len:202 (+) Transcript_47473:1411-2016(+)
MGMPSASHSGLEVTSLPAPVGRSMAALTPATTAARAATVLAAPPWSQTAATGRRGATPRVPGSASEACAGLNFPASSVIQPPGSLPGIVGCSNHTPGSPNASVRECTLMRKMQLFIMPMTFQVRWAGCMFWFESTARQQISLQSRRREASTSVSHQAQHQCLSVPLAAAISSSGRTRSAISQDRPPSKEISARMTFRPPPL